MNEECCICLEPLEENVHFLVCGHCIHKDCWSILHDQSICPICQTKQLNIEEFTFQDDPKKKLIYQSMDKIEKKKIDCCCIIC